MHCKYYECTIYSSLEVTIFIDENCIKKFWYKKDISSIFSHILNLHSFLQPSESTCTILIYLRGINYNRIFLGEPKPEAFHGLPKVGNVRQKTKSRRMWWCSWKTFDSICVLICVSWRRAVRLILKSYDPLIRLVHTQSSPSKE